MLHWLTTSPYEQRVVDKEATSKGIDGKAGNCDDNGTNFCTSGEEGVVC
jgi:hypothetical protein